METQQQSVQQANTTYSSAISSDSSSSSSSSSSAAAHTQSVASEASWSHKQNSMQLQAASAVVVRARTHTRARDHGSHKQHTQSVARRDKLESETKFDATANCFRRRRARRTHARAQDHLHESQTANIPSDTDADLWFLEAGTPRVVLTLFLDVDAAWAYRGSSYGRAMVSGLCSLGSSAASGGFFIERAEHIRPSTSAPNAPESRPLLCESATMRQIRSARNHYAAYYALVVGRLGLGLARS